MRESFSLTSYAAPTLQLRTIDASDCDRLREWKNANRSGFFFQGLIDPEGQRRWFEGYLDRPQDFMFMVETAGERIGCMGFRMLEGAADVYNVIRGEEGPSGHMSTAFRVLCSFARATFSSPVLARVLKTNPAVAWYRKNVFDIAAEEEMHYLMRLDEARFEPVPFLKSAALPAGGR
jgi:hypothetical protein